MVGAGGEFLVDKSINVLWEKLWGLEAGEQRGEHGPWSVWGGGDAQGPLTAAASPSPAAPARPLSLSSLQLLFVQGRQPSMERQ